MTRVREAMIVATLATAVSGTARGADLAPPPALPAASGAPSAKAFLDRKASNDSSFTFDYGVPTSPALTLTGLSAEKLNTSTSLKPFVMAVPDLFKQGGPTSLAFDASLGSIMVPGPQQNRYSDYVSDQNLGRRLAYRTRLGVVVDKGRAATNDAAASKLGFGFSASLLDDSDPLMATNPDGSRVWESCVFANIGDLDDTVAAPEGAEHAAISRVLDRVNGVRLRMGQAGSRTVTPAVVADVNAIQDALGAAAPNAPDYNSSDFDVWVAAARDTLTTRLSQAPAVEPRPNATAEARRKTLIGCATQASQKAQISQDLDVGAGAVWSGDNGRISHLRRGATVVWAAYRLPLGTLSRPWTGVAGGEGASGSFMNNLMVGGRARFAWNDTLATGDSATPNVRADVRDIWGGLEYLNDEMRIAAQYGWFDADTKRPQDAAFGRSSRRWLISGAYKLDGLVEGAWLTFSYGQSESTLDKFDDKVALVSVTFAPPTLSSMFKDK